MGGKKRKILSKFVLISFSIILLVVSLGLNFFLGFSELNVEDAKSKFQVENISIREGSENNALWEFSYHSITANVASVTSSGGCGSSETTSQNGSIFLIYEGTDSANFNFKYDLNELNGGKFQINGQSLTGVSGSYDLAVNNGDEIQIYIESTDVEGATCKAKISQFTLITDSEVEIRFLKQDGGIYYLNDSIKIEEDYILKIKGNEEFTVRAEPADNYAFFGWYLDDNLISLEQEISMFSPTSCTLYGRFISNEKAFFSNSGSSFPSLSEAINSAKNQSDKKIVLIKSGKIDQGTYLLSSGMTLVIPDSSSATIYENGSQDMITDDSLVTPTEYSRLDVPANTTIKLESGACLYVGGKATAIKSQPASGIVNGPYGHIRLIDETSLIILGDGSSLACYGYITGNGLVEALSGSEVYELFQIYGWRGGSFSSGMINNDKKVFMFNQYYVQNVECKLRMHKGATEKIVAGVTVTLFGTRTGLATFIGESGIFRISDGYLDRVYDVETDRIIYTIAGSAVLSSISINISVSIDSSKYVLPITNNFTINVLSGSEVTIGQDMALLPGVILNIEEGATMYFSENVSLYVYDTFWWAKRDYASSKSGFDINPINYSATKGGAPGIRNKILDEDFPDAEINLNGLMVINNNAAVYTTIHEENGSIIGAANIHSSNGTGVINYVNALGSLTFTYQISQPGKNSFSKDKCDSIPIKPALLKNGKNANSEYFDPSLVEGGVVNMSVSFDLATDSWRVGAIDGQEYSITYIDPVSNKEFTGSYFGGVKFVFPSAEDIGFSFNSYNLKYWKLEEENLFFKPGDEAILDYGDLRVIAVWGGWITNSDSESYYIDYETGTFITGLNKVPSQDSNNNIVCLFDDNGKFLANYNGPYLNEDERLYFLEFGVAHLDKGFIEYTPDLTNLTIEYLYVSGDGDLYRNGKYYLVSEEGDTLPSGFYEFNENGYIVREDSDYTTFNQQLYIKNDVTYIDGIRVSYGLFEQDNYLYYSDSNGNIVKDKTFYVSDNNGYNIDEGLYYFNSEGKMCDEKLNVIEVSSLA